MFDRDVEQHLQDLEELMEVQVGEAEDANNSSPTQSAGPFRQAGALLSPYRRRPQPTVQAAAASTSGAASTHHHHHQRSLSQPSSTSTSSARRPRTLSQPSTTRPGQVQRPQQVPLQRVQVTGPEVPEIEDLEHLRNHGDVGEEPVIDEEEVINMVNELSASGELFEEVISMDVDEEEILAMDDDDEEQIIRMDDADDLEAIGDVVDNPLHNNIEDPLDDDDDDDDDELPEDNIEVPVEEHEYLQILSSLCKDWILIEVSHRVSKEASSQYWKLANQMFHHLYNTKGNIRRKIPQLPHLRRKVYNDNVP